MMSQTTDHARWVSDQSGQAEFLAVTHVLTLAAPWGSLWRSELIHKVLAVIQKNVIGKLAKLPAQPINNLQTVPFRSSTQDHGAWRCSLTYVF